MLGIVIGGGLLILGMVSLAIGYVTLSGLTTVEAWLPMEQPGPAESLRHLTDTAGVIALSWQTGAL